MDILVYGAGYYYRKYRPFLEQMNIVAIIDNDREKQGTSLDGHRIISVDDGLKNNYEKIFVFGKYEREKKLDLERRGVGKDKICGKEYILANLNGYWCMEKKYTPKKVCIIVYDLELNGATIAGLEAAKIMRELGFEVTIASPSDGPIRERCLACGLSVILDHKIIVGSLLDFSWCREADLIWINTINLFYILSKRDYNKKTILWLHDPNYTYDIYSITGKLNERNLYVYGVGEIAINAFKNHLNTSIAPQELKYYIEDFKRSKKKHDKFVFAIVGSVCENKNQLLFIKAASMVPRELSCAFWIIGNTTSKYASELKAQAVDDRVKFFDELDREELKECYREIDALVVTSIEDVMPIVATEAMMNEIGCIVSDNVGTAKLLSEKNGLLFKTDNAIDLCSKMLWAYEHKSAWAKICQESRQIYEKNFSRSVFKCNISAIMTSINM